MCRQCNLKNIFTILLSFFSLLVLAHKDDETNKASFSPVLNVVTFQLGNKTISIKTYQYGIRKDVVMINLHGNEKTSLLAAMQWLKANGGLLIKLENGDQRNISFNLDTAAFQFDPNHIFSAEGIRNDFVNNKHQLAKASSLTQKLGKKILSLIPENATILVALHNNFDGDYSINSYLKGHERAMDALKVFKNPARDEDDIFLTTNAGFYQQLSAEGYNTILQNARTVKKDGSLSVYYKDKKTIYLNCETEHDKNALYLQMLNSAMNYIERRSNNEMLLVYTCADTLGLLQKSMAIYQDSLYMGEIKSAYRSKDGSLTTGKFSWPEKTKTAEKLVLNTVIGNDGKPVCIIQSMVPVTGKKETTTVQIELVNIGPAKDEKAKELVDSTIKQ